MPGTLYVVATPIGNLEDVTLRALRILREVSLIAAEDTRRTARLLQHYSISTPTTSLHEHNEGGSAGAARAAAAGESIALVSDAGTPVVSDPGQRPGRGGARGRYPGRAHSRAVSARMAALSASGLPAEQFLFLGFPPTKVKRPENCGSSSLAEQDVTTIVCSRRRIGFRQTLADLLESLGDRPHRGRP